MSVKTSQASLQTQASVDAVSTSLEACEIADDKYEGKRPRCMGRCDIALGDISRHNVKQLKLLNRSFLPVVYTEKFYENVTNMGEMAKLAYLNDLIVGGVCCKVDATNGQRCIYIMTLGTLASYRRYGVGTLLLEHVFYLCRRDPSIKIARLHVQSNNHSALEFYKKFGFDVVAREAKYYDSVQPNDAFCLEKAVN